MGSQVAGRGLGPTAVVKTPPSPNSWPAMRLGGELCSNACCQCSRQSAVHLGPDAGVKRTSHGSKPKLGGQPKRKGC